VTDGPPQLDPRGQRVPEGLGEESPCNPSANPTLEQVLEAGASRRGVMRGALLTAVGTLFGTSVPSMAARAQTPATQGLLGFKAVPISTRDTVTVPEGYRTQVLIPAGTPISGAAPSAAGSGTDQARQIGAGHDGMHFFPIEGRSPYEGSSQDALLVLNHEWVEPRFLHVAMSGRPFDSNAVPMKDGVREPEDVQKEIDAHGVSIVRIRKQAGGVWAVARDPRNRRITGATPIEIAGPVRGSDLVKTKHSPDGTRTRGTLNNCAHGVTPWNTYLTCEENWAGYFKNTDQRPAQPREHSRYGVRARSRYGWELARGGDDAFARFDASRKGAAPTQDYRNEPNTFGWVVEINPWDPESTPIKRTALGRFAHEGVVFAPTVAGRPVVCYSGDDAPFEYIYKFVSARPYQPGSASGALLDDGTLYVAKFNDDGSGDWLPLVFRQGRLIPENGFTSQADVLVNTRSAADAVGATKMDRPEWGAVDANTGEVYFSLTNNAGRRPDEVNGANPRARNLYGHIVRWNEARNDPTSRTFRWSIFVLAGDPANSKGLNGRPLTADSFFGSPDGLWFDRQGRLWIQTDYAGGASASGPYAGFGNCQMLAADPKSGEIRRFLVGPRGQEITGVTTTPDGRTMFVNVQHPGGDTSAEDFAAGRFTSHWPDGGNALPRSATVVITRNDGGVIGG